MSGYTPLFNSIVTSSIWQEDKDTRLVWVTMLAMADAHGVVEGSIIGLANIANVEVDECEKALYKLKNPDKYSRTKDNEGRRIIEIDGGWKIINHRKFREKAKSRAEYMRKWREEKKKKYQKEKEEQTQTQTQTSIQHETSVLQHVTVTNCNSFCQDRERWNNIAFTVGLTDEEAQVAFDNFEANGWKRANNVKIESWEQIPGLLRYWRNNRGQFENKKTKNLPIIAGKKCSKCPMPAVYKDTSGEYDFYYCSEHMPEKVKEKYS